MDNKLKCHQLNSALILLIAVCLMPKAYAECLLLDAVENNNIGKAKTLITFADVNCKNQYGAPLLLIASSEGEMEMVELLLSRGADANARDSHDRIALHYARNKDIAEALLAHGAIVDAKTDKGETPLWWFAGGGLMALGLRPHGNEDMLAIAKVLISHGADIEMGTPLNHAAVGNEIEMAKLLIAHGANVKDKGALNYAVGNGDYVEMAQLLVESGAGVNTLAPNGDYPLQSAAFRGNVKCINFLLSKGADPNIMNKRGNTALEYTAQSDYYAAAAEALLRHGADPNVRNSGGRTPLGYAAQNGAIKVAEVLLAYKADVNVSDRDGNTPLQGAIKHGLGGRGRDLVEMLVKHGANVTVADHHGETPLQMVSKQGSLETAKLLIDHGADVKDGSIYSAIRYANVDMVEFLLEHGANAMSINLDNIDELNTPHYKEKIAVLRKYGAS